MSSFFTAPASQRKRKRAGAAPPATYKRRNTAISGPRPQNGARARREREDSVTDVESEDDEHQGAQNHEEEDTSESDLENETAAERRLKLAERYLENLKGEVEETTGFDAADLDRDLIAERLKEDVAEGKGRLYRRIAADLSFSTATHTTVRPDAGRSAVTAVAACPPYFYTATKDAAITKWEIPSSPSEQPTSNGTTSTNGTKPTNISARRRPLQLVQTKPPKKLIPSSSTTTPTHHTAPILTLAASPDNRFLASGSSDKHLLIHSSTLSPLRSFPQHRDAVTSLAFRRNTNQLFSASMDRTVKTWSLDELAYVETLFGHQDGVVDVDALGAEVCVSVGARDRTARLWRVVEEAQLVFRGGGGGGGAKEKGREKRKDGKGRDGDGEEGEKRYAEGSIDRIAMIDDATFVTGSDNGALCLWSIHKKKPVFTVPLAHGADPPMRPGEVSAEKEPQGWTPPVSPRWITALRAIPYSDVIVSGSWDGWVRVWRVSEDKRRIEALGVVGGGGVEGDAEEHVNGVNGVDEEVEEQKKSVRGVVNDLAVFEKGERGKDGVCIVAAVGTEHRLGRWLKVKGKNCAVVFDVPRESAAREDSVSGAGNDVDITA